MRVGSEGVAGAPLDATAGKSAGAAAYDAGGAGSGFFALLALLQHAGANAGAVTLLASGDGPGEATGDDGDALESAEASDAVAAGATDVVIELSDAVAIAAAATGAGVGAVSASGGAGAVAEPAARLARNGGATVPTAEPATSGVAVVQPGTAGRATANVRSLASVAAEPATATLTGAARSGERAPATIASGPAGTQAAAAPRAASLDPAASIAESGPPAPRAAPAVFVPEPAESAEGAETSPQEARAADRSARAAARDVTVEAEPAIGRVEGEAEVAGARRDLPGTAARAATRAAFHAAGTPMEPARPEAAGPPAAAPTLAHDGTGGEPATRATSATPRASLAEGGSLPGWIERVASAQRLGGARRATALRFDLEPAGLGRIEVRLSFGAGGVRAQVIAEHEHTRALLAQQQPQLASAFERNDVRLESFLVDVGVGGDASGEARREVEDPAAYDAAFANGAAEDPDDEPAPLLRIAPGLLSVRA